MQELLILLSIGMAKTAAVIRTGGLWSVAQPRNAWN